MVGQPRWMPVADIFDLQREADRLFNQFWNDLPGRASAPTSNYPFTVHTTPDAWRLEIPMPGIDPKDVAIEMAGHTLSIRAERSDGVTDGGARYAQSITVPQFLDVDKVNAAHRHGMLELTLPVKESVKPRRVAITGIADAEQRQKQLTTP